MNTSIPLDIQTLWNLWTTKRDEKAANELIAHYMYLVDFHVERVASQIPDSFDKNDLKSLGLMGLFDALEKFEPTRNLKFDTYATIRIRGSIIDGLRKEDWLPRSLRDQTKKIDKVAEQLEQQLKRTPTAEDLAEVLNMDPEEIETIVHHSLNANLLSLDMTVRTDESDDKMAIATTIKDEEAIDPDRHVLFTELQKELSENIKKLNKNEQLVVSLFYFDELTFTEIGEILQLTTSRISQIHKRALFKLNDSLSTILKR